LTEETLTTRTPEAHAAALATFRKYGAAKLFSPPSREGIIIFPGVDGGGEWGGPAFDPQTALLYVNSNEMGWMIRMQPRADRSLYNSNCASCHREDMKGTPGQVPSLVDIASRRSRDEIGNAIRQGTGRMPA